MRHASCWPGMIMCGVLACGPGLPGEEPGSTSTAGEGSPTTGVVGGAGLVGATGTTGTTGGVSTSTGGSTTDSGADDTLAVAQDIGTVQCNPFMQECPEGYKCAPYSSDGGGWWDDDKCVPVMEDPVGVHEPCFAEDDGLSGIDNCDVGLMCWDVDDEGQGHCVALCMGSAEQGICEEGFVCAVPASGTLPLCLKGCDPLAQECDDEDVCIGNPNGEGFLCVLDASGDEGQAHDPCEFANSCDPGLVCNAPTAAVECDQDAMGCCEPFCDLTDPNADEKCPGMGQVCNPYYEEGTAPPDHEDVGFCALPM